MAGTAHIGVLSALEEAGIRIDYIAGASSGAMVAALYSYGYTSSELMEFIPAFSNKYLDYDYINFISRFVNFGSKIKGFIKGERIRAFIAGKTGHAQMTDLKLPVCITATDLRHAKQVLFVSRPLKYDCEDVDIIPEIGVADAVRASLSIPVLFKPFVFGDRVLIDGGLMDNCPVAAVRALGAEQVIAVDLVCPDPVDMPFDSLRSIIARTVTINLAIKAKHNTMQANIVLKPEVGSVGVFDFSKLGNCVEKKGYEYTRGRINQIKEALEKDPVGVL